MGAAQAEACSDRLTSFLPSSFSPITASSVCTRGLRASSCEAGGPGCSQGKEPGPGGTQRGNSWCSQWKWKLPVCWELCSLRAEAVACCANYVLTSFWLGCSVWCCWEGNEPQLPKLSCFLINLQIKAAVAHTATAQDAQARGYKRMWWHH